MKLESTGFVRFFRARRDPNLLPISNSRQILDRVSAQKCVDAIRKSAGINDILFDRFYKNAIHNVAELVQLCPGSEAHHHAWPGGLISHILESCANALELRKAVILPVGSEPEEVARKSALYTYAVFAGCLLHDVAKPLTDQRITLHTRTGRYFCDWDPAERNTTSVRRAAYMQIRFRPDRVYAHHQHSSLIFLQRVLPAVGFQWIQSDTGVYGDFLDAFASEPGGPIYKLMAQGDQISVSKALGAQNLPQFAGSRPLSMKIKTAIRYLVKRGDLPLNRRGAAGWVDERAVWLVSKRAVDAVREHLTREGHTGIPGDNNRIFDVMSEGGLIELNPQGKAIWRCRVTIGDWSPEESFSVIRLSHETIWSDPATVQTLEGQIEIVNDDNSMEVGESSPETPAIKDTDPGSVFPRDNRPVIETVWPGGTTAMPSGDHQEQAVQPPEVEVAAGTDPEKADAGTGEAGERFRGWIESGINQGDITSNTAESFVHFLDQGVLLVSPRAVEK
ncbi:MAG: hypothetical protein F4X92_06350 [Gammaproteobacteria bacterium]|nr:hypothetical protein [Gammaproteobacteria bacterium]